MHQLGTRFEQVILEATMGSRLEVMEVIQELWSGYGKILRVRTHGGGTSQVVVKHVQLEDSSSHPRGWNSDASHQRKVRSYQIETAWYRKWSHLCDFRCRIPALLAYDSADGEVLMVLEDLDQAGFPARHRSVEWPQIEICLGWLANFHATFLGRNPEDLWEIGSYWHLGTRADELEVLKSEDPALHRAATEIDARLNEATFQSFVHGDAKLANFCFKEDGSGVAAVDFQYVGGGCGMKDVAYFIGSCLDEQSCERLEEKILDCYFLHLNRAMESHQPEIKAADVIDEWRILYPVAWTDFHRFLKGWSPEHWKINSYSERLTKQVLGTLPSHRA